MSKRRIVVLGIASVLSGFAEAAVLVIVARIALVISDSSESATIDIGPVRGLDLSIPDLLIVATVVVGIRLLLLGVTAWLPARMSSEVQATMRRSALRAYLQASWPTQAAQREGHLQDVMTTHMNRATQTVLLLAESLSAGLNFVVLVLSAMVISPVAASSVAVAALLLFLLLRPVTLIARRYSVMRMQANTEFAEGVSETVHLAEEIRVFGVADAHSTKVERSIDEAELPNYRAQLLGRMITAVYQSVAIGLVLLGLAVVYWVGADDVATLGAVVLILIRGLSYSQALQAQYHRVKDIAPYISKIASEIRRFEQRREPDGDRALAHVESIRFADVHFAYRRDLDVLHDVSFEVHAGEVIGVVGPSGAGKSTLVQLLLRLRHPTVGQYLVNDRPAASYRNDDWVTRFVYVPQDSRLLHATVRDNIRFYRDEVSDEAVVDAAKRAQIHHDIIAMADGYDTVVGERVSAVSGGQRQRLCLARALATDPEVLVLDEPTSALDVQSEALVQASLEQLRGRVTLFVIAHRLSTLNICDRIMVFEEGRLAAFASAAELLETEGFYQHAAQLSELR